VSEDVLARIAAALEGLAATQVRIAVAMEKMEAAPDPINVVSPQQAPDPWGGLWDMMQAMNPMAARRPQ
jgi:hypothetical protein